MQRYDYFTLMQKPGRKFYALSLSLVKSHALYFWTLSNNLFRPNIFRRPIIPNHPSSSCKPISNQCQNFLSQPNKFSLPSIPTHHNTKSPQHHNTTTPKYHNTKIPKHLSPKHQISTTPQHQITITPKHLSPNHHNTISNV